MTDSLQFVEGRVRQRSTFPANFQPPIRKVIDVDHFAAKANCQAFRLKRQLHTTVVHHQLVRYLTLLAPAQDFIQILPGVEQTMEVFVLSRELGKATVVVGDKAGQKAAIESLMLVAELGGPTMFARIGVMRALNRMPNGCSTVTKGSSLGTPQVGARPMTDIRAAIKSPSRSFQKEPTYLSQINPLMRGSLLKASLPKAIENRGDSHTALAPLASKWSLQL
jgi:hypothetical protein